MHALVVFGKQRMIPHTKLDSQLKKDSDSFAMHICFLQQHSHPQHHFLNLGNALNRMRVADSVIFDTAPGRKADAGRSE